MLREELLAAEPAGLELLRRAPAADPVTASERSLPAEKRTRCFAGILILARVWGFTPIRAAAVLTPKDPKPVRRTSSPPLRASRITSSAD